MPEPPPHSKRQGGLTSEPVVEEGAAGIEEIPSQFCSAVASSTDNKSAQQHGEVDVLAQDKPTMEKLTKLSFMISYTRSLYFCCFYMLL
uniref:Uncharacterized protein n=1 Tax=Aegilops tauschii TaxID=37682 RepID=R7WFK7_AEGTA